MKLGEVKILIHFSTWSDCFLLSLFVFFFFLSSVRLRKPLDRYVSSISTSCTTWLFSYQRDLIWKLIWTSVVINYGHWLGMSESIRCNLCLHHCNQVRRTTCSGPRHCHNPDMTHIYYNLGAGWFIPTRWGNLRPVDIRSCLDTTTERLMLLLRWQFLQMSARKEWHVALLQTPETKYNSIMREVRWSMLMWLMREFGHLSNCK